MISIYQQFDIFESFETKYGNIYISIYLFTYLSITYNWHIVYKQDIADSCLAWIKGVPLLT